MAKRFRSCLFVLVVAPFLMGAQGGISRQDVLKDAPVQIDAEKGLQCDKDNKTCKAFRATVIHNEFRLQGAVLKVYFDKDDALQRVEAEGDVRLKNGATHKAQGQKGSFNLKTQVATLSKSAQVQDLKHNRTLESEHIKLTLKKGKAGKLEVKRIDTHTNVRVKTPKEVVKADKGSYVSGRDFIILTGNVRITNKEGQMQGDRAEMNLKTGVSQLKSTKGPVRVYLRAKSKGRTQKVKS